VRDGTTVNANIYDPGTDVYLNGGLQNLDGPALPDGDYYFLVTDPSGHTLLSSDSQGCRQLTVAFGVVSGATGSCQHANGDFNEANGSTPVQLSPFAETPNNGHEYKVWLVPVSCGLEDLHNNQNLLFPHSCAKTDNFKANKCGESPTDCGAPLA
jgi:hypothetical protein